MITLFTGLYAKAGTVVTVTLPDSAIGQLQVSFIHTSWATRLCLGFSLSALSLCLFVSVSLSLPSISFII